IICFNGNSRDTFKMSNKLIDEGYKIFYLADCGYIFDFRMVLWLEPTPKVETIDNFSKTFSTVLSLIMSLPYKHYSFNIYIDNFFSNVLLFLILQKLRINTCETARQNCNSFSKNLRVRKTLTSKQKLDYHFITGMETSMIEG